MSAPVAPYRRWVYALAHDLSAQTGVPADDLAQEGLVALWRAWDTFDPAKGSWASYGTRAARLRMREVAYRGRPFTGEGDGRPGPNSRGLAAEPLESIQEDRLPRSVVAQPQDGAVVLRLAVAEALEVLGDSDRAIVRRRFWEDRPLSGSERVRWGRSIRPRLRIALAGLEAA